MLITAEFIDNQLEDLDYSKEGIAFAQEKIRDLEKDKLLLLELLNESMLILFGQLKDKQKEIFLIAFKMLNLRNISLNKLSEEISEKLDISFSTAKWNLTKLRDLGFFETLGTRGNTKTILISTLIGRTLYSLLAQIKGKKL